MKNKKLQAGFTLIELLAVMIILMAVGTIITSILVSSLRSGNKSTTINDVRQSGNYVIAQMSKMIAYAESFDSVMDTSGGTGSHTDCIPPVVGETTPTPPPLTYSSVTITSFDGGSTTFNCTSDGNLASNSADLFPSTMSVALCYFTCSQNSIDTSPTVGINFTLKENPNGKTLLPEAQTVIDFQTSVTLRNNNLQ
jgi:type II secretory pathway pseudopilin PulG